ncbi:(heptosyl)LPS beta-1,4-glucosyltransferase [Oceanospirillum multiglobuliferum]|uniref:Glycosyltransferase n=2 Tax=Oceanospirillum TaxID=965 RepID=A0A1T4S8X7_9GAMM|nr:glycosyltransferase family 2 protein [Oceanospirillum multiglobuliferum]OPX54369.1 glycosyltransferase [Oceanospirillum multiglobuliferum]SKA24750.1 (heptosyl)LPS beta-1,4-glucosyltransferase [Oceanospirillum multiglobuliferum]
MPTIAAVLIVKNEEKNLAACLESVKWVDQIIVVDSGSTDKTAEIAAQYRAEFYSHNDWQGFGIQRQRAESYVKTDWIFVIDADERVTPELKNSLQDCIKAEKCIGSIARLSWCFGRFIRHSGWYPDRVLRLYPTNAASYNSALVHEKLENPNGLPEKKLQGDLLHFTYDNMRHYLIKSAQYAEAWAEGRAKKGKTTTLSNGVLHALGCFVRMYLIKAGFMDGKAGFLLALLSAHSTFVKYADLWLRTKTTTKNEQE